MSAKNGTQADMEEMIDQVAEQMGINDVPELVAEIGDTGLPMLAALSEADQLLPLFVAARPDITLGQLAVSLKGYEDVLVELLVAARSMRHALEITLEDSGMDLTDRAAGVLGDQVLEMLTDFKECRLDLPAMPLDEIAARTRAIRQQMTARHAA